MILLALLAAFLVGRLSRVAQVEPLDGLGDLVAYVTATLFISTTGNCGCAARRARWNRRWRFPWAARPDLDRDQTARLRAWLDANITPHKDGTE